MRRVVPYLLVLCLMGCDGYEPIDGAWLDPVTGVDFMLRSPCDTHYAIWLDVYEAASTLWGEPPGRIHLWIGHSLEEVIYLRGEWQQWPTGRYGMVWRVPGRWAHVYVLGIGPDLVTRNIMAHELTHVYSRVGGHPQEFYDRYSELVEFLDSL